MPSIPCRVSIVPSKRRGANPTEAADPFSQSLLLVHKSAETGWGIIGSHVQYSIPVSVAEFDTILVPGSDLTSFSASSVALSCAASSRLM